MASVSTTSPIGHERLPVRPIVVTCHENPDRNNEGLAAPNAPADEPDLGAAQADDPRPTDGTAWGRPDARGRPGRYGSAALTAG